MNRGVLAALSERLQVRHQISLRYHDGLWVGARSTGELDDNVSLVNSVVERRCHDLVTAYLDRRQ